MIDLWIPITVAAALLQCVRTAQQRALKPALSNNGANYVRYLFGAPIAASLLIGLMLVRGDAAPTPNAAFLAWALTGGVAQIVATSALLMALSLRNFAVGTAFSKTEAVQTAIIGGVLLGEHLSGLAWAAIAVGVVGVLLAS